MLNYYIHADQTDVSVVIRIIDSADGTPETGVTSATAGLALEYRRELASSTAITESDLAALTTAHTDGGMRHIGNGYYRLDLPDAACATGAAGCLVHGTATGMIVVGAYIHLNLQNAADIADAVHDEALAGHATAGSAGKTLADAATQASLTSAHTKLDTIDDFVDTEIAAIQTSLTTLATYVDTEVAAIKAKTDQMTYTVANILDVNVQRVVDIDLATSGTSTQNIGGA